MHLTVKFLFSLFLLLSPSFAFTQTDNTASSNNVGDINNDGEEDYKDTAILLWFLNRNRNVEYQPEIKSFKATPSKISVNQSSTLQWEIDGNPTSVSIDPVVGDVTNLRKVTVEPTATTTYTLTAVNSEGSATAQVTVYVAPNIVSFTSSPQTITSGEASTLQWNIEGEPTEVSIDQGIGVVMGSSVTVNPTKTTTYILQAAYSGGSVSREVTVFVKPKIISFEAMPTVVVPETESILSWEISGEPTEVSIDQGVGDVTDLTEVEVFPSTNTTYTITASNQYGSVTKTVTVDVKDFPVIEFFKANTTVLTSGEITILRWRVKGSDSLSLEKNTETTTSTETVTGLSKTVSPQTTTTYTLTATNTAGSVTAIVKVYVLKITSFIADPPIIAPGGRSELSWEIEGEPTEVSINQGVGDVTGSNSLSVSPEQTTTYILTARKTEGDRSRTVRKRITVRIGALPVIESFTASNTILTSSSESVLLSWRVTDSNSLSLTRITDSTTFTQTVTGRSKRFSPQTTTTYTLTATNSVGTVTATVQVYVLRIISFTASPSSIALGGSSELSWEIEGEPTEVSIDPEVGDVTHSNSVSVNPETTTTYTLTVKKTDDSRTRTITRRVQVTVDTPPVIESFTASNTVMTSGESTLLSWDITGSRPISVSLSKTEGSSITSLFSFLPNNSSSRQSPVTTTTYTLTAENSAGTVTETVTVYILNIKLFSASPSTIASGGTSDLIWEIDGEPTEVSIDQGVGDVTRLTRTSVSPRTTTTYTLTAVKTEGSQTKTVTAQTTLNVQTLPIIESFTASNGVVVSGENTLLEWNILGSDPVSVSLSKTEGSTTTTLLSSVPKNSSHSQNPTITTIYTIIASNSLGTATETVTVYFLNINSFTATPPSIAPGSNSVLEWDVDGEPTELSIDQGVGNVRGSTMRSVSPQLDTTYTLTAVKTVGAQTKTVTATTTVDVIPLPVIQSFTVDTPFVSCNPNCFSALLEWTVTGADSLSIDQSVGDVTGLLNKFVTPTETTTYILTATNSSGSVTQSVTLYALKIKEFTASPSSITAGNYSVLEWDVDGEPTSLSIDQGIGDVTGVSSTIVTPDADTTYELTATKTEGATTETVTETVTVTVTTANSLGLVKKNIQDCEECPQLLAIPSTLLGQDSFISVENPNENSFVAVGIKKITGEEWQACVQDNFCTNYELFNVPLNHPITRVNSMDAELYVDWLSYKTDKTYRLLNNREWESIVHQIASGNSSENLHLQNFVTDERNSIADSSSMDSGFRVIRNIDPIAEEE